MIIAESQELEQQGFQFNYNAAQFHSIGKIYVDFYFVHFLYFSLLATGTRYSIKRLLLTASLNLLKKIIIVLYVLRESKSSIRFYC